MGKRRSAHRMLVDAHEREGRAELARVADRVAALCRDGMQPEEIVAAFHAKRRMRAPPHEPWNYNSQPMIGLIPVTSMQPAPIVGPNDPLLSECIMLDVYRGDGDDDL